MNLPTSPRGGRLGALAVALFGASLAVAAENEVPRGSLEVDRSLIRVGVKSQLGWNITYPTKAPDLVDKDEDGNCTTKTRVRVKVRVLAAAFGTDTRWCKVDGYIYINGQKIRIFTGDQRHVDPSRVVYDDIVQKNRKISVTGDAIDTYTHPSTRYSCTTSRSDKSVVALFDGEALPAHQATMYPNMQLNALDYIANYMDADNRARIGSDQVIFLGDFNPYGSEGYDLNDFVIVVTFTEA